MLPYYASSNQPLSTSAETFKVISVVVYLLHITTATNFRYSRQPQHDYLSQYLELNPNVEFHYGDPVNFNYPNNNHIEKPVDEPQEYVPPQSVGSASIPLMPPPAVPVNAVAANVPSNNGAVFLGSGSIGVVRLGNGAFALGSGALGYSDGRSQTRPSANVPVYPPLPANPNLIPAAVPSQVPVSPYVQPLQQRFEYVFPGTNNHIQDPNSYEILRPETAGFGTPIVRPPRPLRMHFAVPTDPVQPANLQYISELPDRALALGSGQHYVH